MNQTSRIAAAITIAFIIFITLRGELPYYLAVFTGTPATATKAQSTQATVNAPGGVTIGIPLPTLTLPEVHF